MPPQLSDRELEERLAAAGNSLLQPPSSLDELLPLLDKIEELLSKVEQSPAKSMQTVLSPLMKALVVETLVKHSDEDVKVGVASCISEITRITAPDAPYDDDKMKDVFQLIVSSFENLSETSSRSFGKRVTILETVAKIRSCVIMLDLECDQMIIEMFQHFLKAIRDYHNEAIFTSMETIMILVLEESEEISSDLLNPLLATLKKDNKNVLPIARKLAESVIKNSSEKLRPYLSKAVKLLDSPPDDYGEVVVSLCRENTDTIGNNNESIPEDTQVVNEGTKGTVSEGIDPTLIGPLKSDNTGMNETCAEETMVDASSSKEAHSDHPVDGKLVSKTESDECGADNSEKLEATAEHSEAQKVASNIEIPSKDVLNSAADAEPATDAERMEAETATDAEPMEAETATEAVSVEATKSLNEVEDRNQLSPSHEPENEAVNVASPSHSVSVSDEGRSKIDSPAKRKKMVEEEMVSVDIASKKGSAGVSASKPRKKRWGGKRQSGKKTVKDKKLTGDGAAKTEGSTSDSEARSLDQTPKLGDAYNKMEDGSSMTNEDGKKISRVKPTSGKDAHVKDKVSSPRSPLKSLKDEGTEEETPRAVSKRKRTPGTEQPSEDVEHNKNLVGSKVRVWWPQDRMFYEGVVDSFDSVKKKHKVVYNDGDEEVLNLKRQRWELIEDDLVSDGDDDAEHSSHDTLSELKKKKKKRNADSEASKSKRQKVDYTPKSKVTPSKSVGKSNDQGKSELEAKDRPKLSKKAVDEVVKPRDHLQKLGGKSQGKASSGGKTKDESSKASAGKTKDESGKSFGGKTKDESSKSSAGKTKDGSGKLSGGKTKDETIKASTGKTKDESGKTSGGKTKDEASKASAGKAKDESGKTSAGKAKEEYSKASAGKTKDDSAKTPSHPKQDSQNTLKSKGKTPQSGKNISDVGATKTEKTSSSKAKENGRKKEKLAADSAKSSELAKGKSTEAAKSGGSEAKSGKKRGR